MAVVLETTLGDITIDLYVDQRQKACLNFLKLCKMKYYNFNLFHTVNQGFIAQTGDPTGSRIGGESIWGVMEGPLKRYFEAENTPRIKHTTTGLVSFVGDKDSMIGSQFFITLAPDLMYLDAQHCVFGEVTEGFEILRQLNEAICDTDHRPYQDIRITHTVVLEDPFPDPENLKVPDGSPEPTAERLQGGRIAPDEEIDETEGKTVHEVQEIIAEKEAKARATILEMIGDIPDAEMAPPENVLFVCKLNPVTTDDDLEIIFSRFGKIKTCEVIRDKKSGDSLQYAFVEFTEQKSCEDAYFKMDNVLIDDRRIHVDFSQSVAKIKWHGKGRGVTHYNEKGEKQTDDPKNDVGNGRYRKKEIRDSPKRNPERREDTSKNRYENGNNRNRPPQNYRDERYRDDRYRQNDRNRYQDNYSRDRRNELESRKDYRPENRRQRSRSREIERSRRNRSRSPDSRGFRDNQRFRQTEQYKRTDERSTSRQNQRFRPEETEYRRKQQKSRSRSRDNQRQRNISPDEKENRRKDAEKQRQSKKIQEISSEEEPKKKKKGKKKRQESSDEDNSSEGTSVKKSKKSKKKKSKKKKQAKSDSDSDSDSSSEEERKKSKKKKKKSKKQESSSDSSSHSDSEAQKKKSKKR